MNYKIPLISIAILDYNKSDELNILLDSLDQNANFQHDRVYLGNGGNQDHAINHYKNGRIDRLILNKANNGGGVGQTQLYKSCLSTYVIFCQVDQYLAVKIDDNFINQCVNTLKNNNNILYIDLANNQGGNKYSDRCHLFNRERYLSIPGIESATGNPGPYAEDIWTEKLIQEYIKETGLKFVSAGLIFGDNGVFSIRELPDGSILRHRCDTKGLWVIKTPTRKFIDYPNIALSELEWDLVINNKWEPGRIPEADKHHSFIHWKI